MLRILFVILLSVLKVSSLNICTRRQFTINSDVIFQRVELPSPEKCIERCLEQMDYCNSVVYLEYKHRSLGMCVLHPENSKTDKEIFIRDTSSDPKSTVYELLDECPSHSKTDLAHRISPIHKKLLASGGRDPFENVALSDSILPDADRFAMQELKREKSDRYAIMESIDEHNPPNPFDSHEENDVHVKDEEIKSSLEGLTPIKPVVLHQGRRMDDYSHCKPGAPCVPTLASLDVSPCPARQGDPCAPKPPCLDNSCFHLDAQPQRDTVSWSEWGQCSATCGLGSKSRTCRGSACVGPSSIPCSLAPCTQWALWSPWSLCSASCGQGEKQRSRTCLGGRDCEGPSVEISSCKLADCPSWSEWGPWEGCSITCGKGRERRMRSCQHGLFCPGSPFDDRMCDRGPCPEWADWTDWTECSKSCGGGEMSRTRDCMGGSCPGASQEMLLCNQERCPEWTQWTAWTVCDEKCGEDSYRLRNRVCLYRGRPYAGCDGSAQDQMDCPARECAQWAEWKEWTDCTVTCGQGHQMRSRVCEGGSNCEGSNSEMKFCQLSSCPYWDEWGPWGGCSVSCGIGVCERRRKCHTDEILDIPSDFGELEDSPPDFESEKAKEALIERSKHIRMMRRNVTEKPRVRRSSDAIFADVRCDGSEVDRKQCDAGPCCFWDQWSEWSPCIGCGSSAVSRRTRECSTNPGEEHNMPRLSFQDDHNAVSSHKSSYATKHSLVSSKFSLDGLTPIVPIVHRGKRNAFHMRDFGCHCPGDPVETRTCPHPAECTARDPARDQPATCQWSSWGEWCGCTKCRPGREVRRRFCDRKDSSVNHHQTRPDPSCHCPGTDEESRTCRMEKSCYGRHSNLIRAEIQETKEEDRYIPIQSSINSVKFDKDSYRRPRPTLKKKDSVYAFSTTPFPYPVCRWSDWSEWSDCDEYKVKERERFCMGGDDQSSNCDCVGLSTDRARCDAADLGDREADSNLPAELGRDRVEAEFDVEDEKNLDSGIDYLLKGENLTEYGYEGPELLNPDPYPRPVRMGVPHAERQNCDWTRWSQWSACTTTCGPGDRLRKRRCECGDGLCGIGLDTEMEKCEKQPCADRRMLPIFEIN